MNQADDEGTAPLFMAAQEGHLPVVQLLLDREAAVNQAHDDGATPLIIAAQNSLISVVQLLLKHEVSDDMHSEARETAYNQGHAAVDQFIAESEQAPVVARWGDVELFRAQVKAA